MSNQGVVVTIEGLENSAVVTASTTVVRGVVTVNVTSRVDCDWGLIEDMQGAVTDATSSAVSRALDQVDAALNGYVQVQGHPEEGQ